jgi:serine/threonine-protein kinase
VVTIYESGQADDGSPYIAMEYLKGGPLRAVLRSRGALPVGECVEILQQAARGDEGELVVKVVDFGIAKLRESAHTVTGMMLGTPAYMSFEQASGMRSDELDARSDIYSLGVAVYKMVTGRLPFTSDTEIGCLLRHLREAPPPFREVAPALAVPAQVEAVVMKALAKDRDARYGSVLEFARAFAEAAKPPVAAAVRRPKSPRATIASLAAALVVVTVAALAWIYWPSATNRGSGGGPPPVVSRPEAKPNPPSEQPAEGLPAATPRPEKPAPGTSAAEVRRKVKAAVAAGDSYYHDGEYDRAIAAYEAGLAADSTNAQLRGRIQRAKTAKAAESSVPQ